MFERGSTQDYAPFFKTLLVDSRQCSTRSITKKLLLPGLDAMAYKNGSVRQLELSGDRALSARRVLEEADAGR